MFETSNNNYYLQITNIFLGKKNELSFDTNEILLEFSMNFFRRLHTIIVLIVRI